LISVQGEQLGIVAPPVSYRELIVKLSRTFISAVVFGAVLISVAGCGSKQEQSTDAEKAAASQEIASKKEAIEADPKIPADKKALALGALDAGKTSGIERR
jgi:hypothetical protein